jgi:hypothetical protein
MTPFEIRLELLKMARDLLTDEFYSKKEQITNNWSTKVEVAKLKGVDFPDHPDMPAFPTEAEIIAKATTLNGFVSQTPQDTKTSKK